MQPACPRWAHWGFSAATPGAGRACCCPVIFLSHNASQPKFFEFLRRKWTKNCLERLVFSLNQCYIHIVFECSVLRPCGRCELPHGLFISFFFLYSPGSFSGPQTKQRQQKREPVSWSPFTVSLVPFLVYVLKSVSTPCKTIEKGHGRIEKRKIKVAPVNKVTLTWSW